MVQHNSKPTQGSRCHLIGWSKGRTSSIKIPIDFTEGQLVSKAPPEETDMATLKTAGLHSEKPEEECTELREPSITPALSRQHCVPT